MPATPAPIPPRRSTRSPPPFGNGAGPILSWLTVVEGDAEHIPPVPAEPVSRPGDLWILGDHRIICGDSTDPETVAGSLDGAKPHLMVTDPPYGVEYDPEWRNRAGVSTTERLGRVENDHQADWREAWALFPGEVAYVWHARIYATTVAESLLASGFSLRSQIIWAKPRALPLATRAVLVRCPRRRAGALAGCKGPDHHLGYRRRR